MQKDQNIMTTTNKIIRRNATKQIDAIFSKVSAVKVYSLDNCFSGQAIDAENMARALEMIRADVVGSVGSAASHCARMTQSGPNGYKVRVHSNLWYEMTVSA